MKMKCAGAVGSTLLMLMFVANQGHSQYGSYIDPVTSANPYGSFTRAPESTPAAAASGALPSARSTVSDSRSRGWNPFRSQARQTVPPPAPAPEQTQLAQSPMAPPVAGMDYVQSPTTPEVIYIDQIRPTEQPRNGAAYTVPAETAPPGSISSLNRQINFPRDPGDDVDVLKLQIFLDYHGYSPGEIDGRWGYNTERALYVYQKNNGMPATGQLDERILSRLNGFKDGYLVEYAISADEVKGPYKIIPRDYHEQAKLKWLPYESAAEALGEKFHCSLTLIKKLNPGVNFDALQSGQVILAPNVRNGIDEKRGQVGLIRVSKYNKWLEAFDSSGNFMFYYPSTLGSQHDPLPLGNYSVANVVTNPHFKFQPKLFWDHDPNEKEEMIPPGPNSPVGKVWIGTTRKSVGIHGTPNPENISKNTSHGCIRLTNWDAEQLSKRVKPGVKIEFVQ